MNAVKNSANNSKKYQVTFQLVPPHVHLRNAAERAIQTWKIHFLAGIATLDPNFPIQELDILLPQCDITLNLLRYLRRQPNLSAYASTFGNFNFKRTPLSPLGTLFGCLVDEDTDAWWGDRSSVEVEVVEGSCIC